MTGENSGRWKNGLRAAVEDRHSKTHKPTPRFFSFNKLVFRLLLIIAGSSLSWAGQADKTIPQNATKSSPAVPVGSPASFVSDEHLDKTPPRETQGLDIIKMGWTYNCMECHKLLEAKWHFDRPLTEHRNLQLDHGNNRFCLNCHHPTNRNAFVDYDGSEIRETEVVMLCAKCHGPTHRDWKAGVHGRRNGYWNVQKGIQTQLRCIQCHDPHDPKFKPVKPLAPPRYPKRASQPHDFKHMENEVHEKGSSGQSSLATDSVSQE